MKKNSSQKINQTDTKISVIIAAKNEEENILNLIDTLSNQDYDKNLFEVIIVDDNSTDKTYETACSQITGKENFSVLKAESKPFPGKKGALTIGIKKAKNDFIMITDADCLPEKNWIKSFSSLFSQCYDFVFGIAPLIQNSSSLKKNWVSKLSCFENLRTHLLTFSFAGVSLAYSAAARSFGFKKSSFEKINGYSNTLETLSGDDDLLLREAIKNKMKIGVVTEKDSFVYSYPENNLKDYLKQKARHTQTSLHYLPVHKILLGFWHLINLIFLFSPFLVFFHPAFIFFFLLKIIMDVIVVSSIQKKFGYCFKLLSIIIMQILYEIFLIVNFLNALKGKNEWK